VGLRAVQPPLPDDQVVDRVARFVEVEGAALDLNAVDADPRLAPVRAAHGVPLEVGAVEAEAHPGLGLARLVQRAAAGLGVLDGGPEAAVGEEGVRIVEQQGRRRRRRRDRGGRRGRGRLGLRRGRRRRQRHSKDDGAETERGPPPALVVSCSPRLCAHGCSLNTQCSTLESAPGGRLQ
jgi:hypothetical protein